VEACWQEAMAEDSSLACSSQACGYWLPRVCEEPLYYFIVAYWAAPLCELRGEKLAPEIF
jgi:hypothetical protein